MIPHREDRGSLHRQHGGIHLLNKHILFSYVLPAPPNLHFPRFDRVNYILRRADQNITKALFKKKNSNKWKGLQDLCEMDWSEVPQHRIMISETSDGSPPEQQLGYCPQLKPGPAPWNLPQRTLRRGQCAAKRRCGTKSDVSAYGSWNSDVQVTMILPEFYILVDVSEEHNHIFIVKLTIPGYSGLEIFLNLFFW